MTAAVCWLGLQTLLHMYITLWALRIKDKLIYDRALAMKPSTHVCLDTVSADGSAVGLAASILLGDFACMQVRHMPQQDAIVYHSLQAVSVVRSCIRQCGTSGCNSCFHICSWRECIKAAGAASMAVWHQHFTCAGQPPRLMSDGVCAIGNGLLP